MWFTKGSTGMVAKARIIIVDDEVSIVEVLKSLLLNDGFEVKTASGGDEALQILGREHFDLMLTDIRMQSMDGITLLQKARELQSSLCVIMMTAYAAVETAMKSMKSGAFDYICKPFRLDDLRDVIGRALDARERAETASLESRHSPVDYHFGTLVGDSRIMQQHYEQIRNLNERRAHVLLFGGPGSGKATFGEAIADGGTGEIFSTLDCSKAGADDVNTLLFGKTKRQFMSRRHLSPGLLEKTRNSLLLIHKIDRMPSPVQERLATALVKKEIPSGGSKGISFNGRIVATVTAGVCSNQLEKALAACFSDAVLHVPALAERKEDIPLLIHHFLEKMGRREKKTLTISRDAVAALVAYDWPENVRELEDVLGLAVRTAGRSSFISPDILPDVFRSLVPTQPKHLQNQAARGTCVTAFLREKERLTISQVIGKCGGDREKTAALLGISVAALHRKLAND